MSIKLPEYEIAVKSLTPILFNLPPLLVAIDGRDNDGKTTLGRYLAWHFNVTLLESDLYLLGDNSLRRRTEEIKRIVDARINRERPIIVEGVGVLQILEDIGRKSDFHLYIRNINTHWSGGSVKAMLADYEKKFALWERANLVVETQYD